MPRKEIPEAASFAAEFDALADDKKEALVTIMEKLKESEPQTLSGEQVSTTYDGLSDEGKSDVSRFITRVAKREERMAARNA